MKNFYVKCILFDEYNNYIGIKKIGKYDANQYENNAYVMVNSKEFLDDIKPKLLQFKEGNNIINNILIRRKDKSSIDPIIIKLSSLEI